jgi:hypothetical protein
MSLDQKHNEDKHEEFLLEFIIDGIAKDYTKTTKTKMVGL